MLQIFLRFSLNTVWKLMRLDSDGIGFLENKVSYSFGNNARWAKLLYGFTTLCFSGNQEVFGSFQITYIVQRELLRRNKLPYPAGIYLLKFNNRNTRTRYEFCSKLTTKSPEWHHWRRSRAFIVNFEHIWHLVLVFPFLTLNM